MIHMIVIVIFCLIFLSVINTTTTTTISLNSLCALQMEGRLAEELYAESLQLSKLELTSTSADDQENKANGKM